MLIFSYLLGYLCFMYQIFTTSEMGFYHLTIFLTFQITGVSKRLTDIRLEMGDYLDSLATEAMQSSLPIVRPLWMFNSLDPVSYEVDDQV